MKILFFLVVRILFFVPLLGIGQNEHFINLKRENGLVSSFIKVIYEDSYGYMWFGTNNGLNRYDGINMDTYQYDKQGVETLSNNDVIDLIQTSTGKMLVCTAKSIDVFNYKTEKFESLNISGNFNKIIEVDEDEIWVLSKYSIVNVLNSDLELVKVFNLRDIAGNSHQFKNRVVSFAYDKNNLMLYVAGSGFYLLDLASKKTTFKTYDVLPPSTSIKKIYAVSKSEFWIMTLSGIFVVKNGRVFKRIVAGAIEEAKNLTSNFILDFKVMPNNEYWIFTDGGGINIYNAITEKFRYIDNDLNNKYSLASNFIYTAYLDRNSSLWLGTVKNGVSQLDDDNPFTTYKLTNKVSNKIFDIPITSLFLDSKNKIWIGSDGNGLYQFEHNVMKEVIYDKSIKTITSINEISPDVLVLGTFKNGLSTFDVKKNILTNQKHINERLNLKYSITFIEKEDKTFWIGGSEIIRFHSFSNNKLIVPDKNYKSNNIRALSFKKHSEEVSFLGNYDGFYKYTATDFSEVLHLSQFVNSIYTNNKSDYWLASAKGLVQVNINNKKNNLYGAESGLNNENLNSLLDYDTNNLWLGTNQGISKFNIKEGIFTNYTYKDGFLDNSFKCLKSVKTKDGRLYFGGEKGLLVFHPDSIKTKTKTNKVVFTKLFVNHKKLVDNENEIINSTIEEAKQITLKHTQKVFTLHFTSFNFRYAKSVNFSYKLEGYNEEWSTTNERFLTFMNLAPGTYYLKIKASSLSGFWDAPFTTIAIKILPAWWQTWWFKLLVFSLILVFVFIINKSILYRERLKQEYEFETKSLKDQKELDEKQLQFFTNLSHEIRTPLSLIISPVETIIKEVNSFHLKNNLSLIQKNALRINRLINRGIDFRKTQFKEPDIQVVHTDVVFFLKELVGSFRDFSMSKNIEIEFVSEIDVLLLWFDKYMIETVFYNLLSNAFKYSYKNTKIVLKISKTEEQVCVEVQDFGKGISQEDLPYVFERFYQSKNHIGGSGIGLALAKSFICAHKGTINVKSSLGNGSVFKVSLLLGNLHFKKEDLFEVKTNDKSVLFKNTLEDSMMQIDVKLKNRTILIVEDETSLRDYLAKSLSSTYIVVTAENGLEAMEVVESNKIDIIVTDVEMPFMNGIELCKRIKENVKTCELPIVLLTAKTLNEEKVAGYEIGADAYLEKPFSLNVLMSRINNLLQRKTRLNDKMLSTLDIPIDLKTINTSDERFYEQTLAIIENHIDDIDFNITVFSKELGMSKSLIYSKMARITNLSINNLILSVRLNKASQMLIYTQKPIIEISLLVGFQNAKYFSTSFKKKFERTPTKYREENSQLSKGQNSNIN